MSVKLELPNFDVPIVDVKTGRITRAWAQFFQVLYNMSGGGLDLSVGDLLVFNGDRMTNQAVGANGTNLEADNTQSTGVKWA